MTPFPVCRHTNSLRRTNFRRTSLRHTSLRHTNLRRTNLRRTNLRRTSPRRSMNRRYGSSFPSSVSTLSERSNRRRPSRLYNSLRRIRMSLQNPCPNLLDFLGIFSSYPSRVSPETGPDRVVSFSSYGRTRFVK
ncbi:MAG: pentapeptide repeat-containing protein [Thermoguttaceae bacterium]|nr:pentapeptide repeat-containing protein [Thermoguttaceae bacterium]